MEAILTRPNGSIKTISPEDGNFFSDEEILKHLKCSEYQIFEPAFITSRDYILIADSESEEKNSSINSFATNFYGYEGKTLSGNIIICPSYLLK